MKSTPWRSKRQAPGPRKMTLLLVMGLGLSLIAGSCSMGRPEVPNADGLRKRPASYPSPYPVRDPGTWIDNGMLRVRATRHGITWFDVFHPGEGRWYLAKNNLNFVTQVDGKWENTEIERLLPTVEVIRQNPQEIVTRSHYDFPNGARIYSDMVMREGEPAVRFTVHAADGSARIEGFQWHVTFGQAEAVSSLDWEGGKVAVADLPLPFPGDRLKLQYMEWFDDIESLDFRFRGEPTRAPDTANPWWMSRVLGLEQRVTWTKPLRVQDRFAFEARDRPWQPDWGLPKTRPWIEGLWVVRRGGMLDGDELIYRVEDFF